MSSRSARQTREFTELAEVPESGGVPTPRFDHGLDLVAEGVHGTILRVEGSRDRYLLGSAVDLEDVR